jgi:predicted nucleic acid-binding protein
MRFVDVGVFLCAALEDPKKHFKGCKSLLERLEVKAGKAKEKVHTTLLTPTVFYFILENREGLSKEKLTKAILSMRALNITFLPLGDGSIMEEAAKLAEKKGTDFDDALNALVMRKKGMREIYALDPHYDRFEWVKRITPT